MKILHTADWHLGKKLGPFSRLPEQKAVLEEICTLADRESVDVILIAGDLFDTVNPSIEAIELFYLTLKKLAKDGQRAVIGIAGNHDSPDRIEAPDPLARACGIILTGYPHSEVKPFEIEGGIKVLRSAPGFIELDLPNYSYPLRLISTPYANEARLKQYLGNEEPEKQMRKVLTEHWQHLASTFCDGEGVNMLMTHLFVSDGGDDIHEWEDEEEKSILTLGGADAIFTSDFPSDIQYAALGHIHGRRFLQQSPYPIAYSSSPLAYSINDPNLQKYVILIEAQPGKVATTQSIELKSGKPTFQVTCHGIEEAKEWLLAHPHSYVELTLKTDRHLEAIDRKTLHHMHDGILRIIPSFTDPELMKFTSGKEIDLSKSMEELFKDFFRQKHKQEINQELTELFAEVLSEDTDI
ncbi:MAG: exonuclease SbcCD subunit D [Bacteroidota bacterium]